MTGKMVRNGARSVRAPYLAVAPCACSGAPRFAGRCGRFGRVMRFLSLLTLGGLVMFAAETGYSADRRPQPPDGGTAKPAVRPMPVVVRVSDLNSNETDVAVEKVESTAAENAFFKRVKVNLTFTNPNSRTMSGELEFPLPEGSFVCGYALEIDGDMIPGVICGKEKARVAFENETRKRVDPGIVEHVKGNIWRTRIFPLNPKTPRKAEIEYIVAKGDVKPGVVYERDGDDVFTASYSGEEKKIATLADKIASFDKGVIIWDSSMSAKSFAAAWRKKLDLLPKDGEWHLIVFNYDAKLYPKAFTKENLLKEIDALVYDGGTLIDAAIKEFKFIKDLSGVLLFTDEIDTMGLTTPKYEDMANVIVASRDDVPARPIEVRKLGGDEKIPDGASANNGTLLATVWAKRRMSDLANQSDSRKDEFLKLARKYSVAGPNHSLIVLETLEQYLEHDIEPSESMSFHGEWKKRRAAQDDPIALKKAKADHEANLLKYWEERVKWWNNPKPPKRTPKSGVFDNAVAAAAQDVAVEAEPVGEMPAATSSVQGRAYGGMRRLSVERAERARAPQERKAGSAQLAANSSAPAVSLKAWDPKTPYLEPLKAASDKDEAYKAYLKEREKYGQSPAFYLDCAGWFYKAGERMTADTIISNLAEFKLEDAALWRSMGWRAREARSYSLSILAFRKALKLRGEEAQSRRDLALVLAEYGKWLRNFSSNPHAPQPYIEEAMKLFADAAFNVRARRSGIRGNDFQVSIIALEELNGLISWVESEEWHSGKKPKVPEFDAAYRRDLPVKLRIVMSWDVDQTDIDIHVLEPNGEEAYYGHRRTSEGGFVSEDVTTGYGPEEYLKKDLERGVYKICSNYFASHQTSLTGAATITVCVYTDWGTKDEKFQLITFRLDKPKNKLFIGEVEL